LHIYQEEWSELDMATENAGIRQVPVERYHIKATAIAPQFLNLLLST